MLRLSIQTRQALAKLTLPLLIVTSVALLLAGRAAPALPERARVGLSDALAPLYAVAERPFALVRRAAFFARDLWALRAENARLRAENARLRHWYDVAMALDAENAELKSNLHWTPDPALTFVTAHVVADAGGVYARSLLLAVGPHHAVARGQIALDGSGLAGRVTEVGARSARVLLITDMNSRIPVTLELSRARAMMVGENSPDPKLLYLPDGIRPAEGERVVTSADAGAFPAGLPVGTVHYGVAGTVEVAPAANLERLELVRIFDYGIGGITPPEAPGHNAIAAADAPRPPF